MHLVTDDTPTGYALNAVLKDNGWFEDSRVDPYGEPFPLLDNETTIIGNFALDPKDDYSYKQPDHYWYFPTYEPRIDNKYTYFNPKVASPLMFLGVMEKLRNEVFYGEQDTTLNQLVNVLSAYSGKKLQYLNPKYEAVINVARNILAYANLYKEQATREVIESYLTIGKAPDETINFLVNNTVFNNARYVEDRVAHAQMFATTLNAQNHPTMNVSVVHAEQDMGLIANEMAKRMVANGSNNYMAITYKNNYVVLTSNVFEQLAPFFGQGFAYKGGAGTYSFFMRGLEDNTLYKAMKEMFKEL